MKQSLYQIMQEYTQDAYGESVEDQSVWLAGKIEDLLDFAPTLFAHGHLEKARQHLLNAADT